MTLNTSTAPHWRRTSAWMAALLAMVIAVVVVAVTPTRANALAQPVPLGTADSFAVLAGESVTNTGPSVITGDVGVHPGTAISGFPPGLVNGTFHSADAVAAQAKSDLVVAYNNAAGQTSDAALPPDAGGLTLVPGVYTASSTLGLTGTLTLDGQNNPDAIWVFQVGSGLTTASASNVSLINGASPCNVFWQIGSSATLGTNSDFVGTIMALTSITANTDADIVGRALARNGSVTLDTNTITRPACNGGTTNGGTTNGGTNGATTNGGTNGATTNGGTNGATTNGGVTNGGVTNGGITNGGATNGGVTNGGTTGGTVGGLLGGVTTGGLIAGTTGGTTGATNGGITNGGTTGGGEPKPPGKPGKPGKPGHGHDKPGKPGHGHDKPEHGKPGHGHGHDKPEHGKPGHGHGHDKPEHGHGHDKPEHGHGHDKPEHGHGHGHDKPDGHMSR
ncbi:ice-binding family protein [Streptomyces sp. ST2-7A]|uniref:ice-binding family protein n=1 Tax=Streptomyces sp. ST2-7A TaxID=2907214 RepID=UPI001F476C36|nr:ice-binding family protein [Streptomyces sp. ST2-7A]MCE7083176.1 ice-binding family protein [Streptomyces sp. ST2-7A]